MSRCAAVLGMGFYGGVYATKRFNNRNDLWCRHVNILVTEVN